MGDISQEQLDAFRWQFDLFEHDDYGSIAVNGLGNVMTALGLCQTEMQLKEMIHVIDLNGNGTIEFSEFIQKFGTKMTTSNSKNTISQASEEKSEDKNRKEKLKQLFTEFDTDGSGKVHIGEFVKALKARGIDAMDAFGHWGGIDENSDGVLTIDEFGGMLDKMNFGQTPSCEEETQDSKRKDELKRIFSEFDKDGSGKVHMGEFLKALKARKIDEMDAFGFWDGLDENGDGVLTIGEFEGILDKMNFGQTPSSEEKTQDSNRKDELKRIFSEFDKDGAAKFTWVNSLKL